MLIRAREGADELAQHAGHIGAHDVLRHAEADPALERFMHHPVPGLVIELHHAAAIAEELLALACQAHAAAMPLHQRLVERRLQALQLHRDGRLGEVQTLGGAGHAAQLGDGHKGPQRRNIEIPGTVTGHQGSLWE